MTMWLPELSEARVPLYVAIAEAVAADVASGRLAPGARLPPQRELAWRLGVTTGTVTRAYAEARRRGLVSGEVGRGTFVNGSERPPVEHFARQTAAGADVINLSLTRPVGDWLEPALADALAALGQGGIGDLVSYGPVEGLPRHRAAGARWLGERLGPVDPARVVVSSGAQNALAMVTTAVLRPGERVVTEALTYPGVKALAHPLGLRLEGLASDGEGLLPEALDAACREGGVRLLYTMPTLHNPTGATQPEERRRALAAVARAHDVLIVEDDVYGFLDPRPIPKLTAIAPERSVFVASPSKFMPPALRIGFLAAPEPLVPRLAASQRALSWMASPVTAAIVCRWIEDGTAAMLAERQREEATARVALVRERLGEHVAGFRPEAAMHIWLKLPSPWRAGELVEEALARRVALTAADSFAVGRARAPHAVRFGLGVPSRADLARALDVIADLLARPPQPSFAVV